MSTYVGGGGSWIVKVHPTVSEHIYVFCQKSEYPSINPPQSWVVSPIQLDSSYPRLNKQALSSISIFIWSSSSTKLD